MTVLTEQQENAAAVLVKLIAAYDARAEEAEERESDDGEDAEEDAATEQAARSIGEQLNAEGGFELMQAVGHRTQELIDAPRYLDFWWSGIGNWRA